MGLANLDDITAASAVTDGDNDSGIDSIYFDRAGNRLLIVQAKFKESGAAPSQQEVLKTISGIRSLLNRQFSDFNTALQQRLDEFEEALDTPGIMVEVILVYLGENLGPHAISNLDALTTEANQFQEVLRWKNCGGSIVYDWLISEQAVDIVSINLCLENWGFVTTPRKVAYGQVSAQTIASLVGQHGKALFQRNIRHYLGSVGVNAAIGKTILQNPGDFFYLNNGITAVVESINQAPGNHSSCNFALNNISIVNGAQTAGSIALASEAGEISTDAKVLITIIEIGSSPDDIGLQITKSRNYQNFVRGVDFAALDPNQERLRQELAISGITYYYRPSAEALVRREDAFTVEDSALALACLSRKILSSSEVQRLKGQGKDVENAVDYSVIAKKEIGRLWDQNGLYYKQLFNENLVGTRMCRLVRIFFFIDQILSSSERSENGYDRRMFFRHGRYFIMAFVAHRSGDILDLEDLEISDADKLKLSHRVNELSELIYAESRSWNGVKGYLALFRNFGDAQPLADKVLTRLATSDSAATQNQP